ncbi:MAG: 4Fe-4S dicluster domain-containing protein [Dehalococcoidales bacterium]|nr:4Fe-4S dicluster domain-containing protein [Dehalococcoidales bacterium]
MQKGFYFDQSRCTGCFTCAVACKDWHDTPAGPANWIRVQALEEGKFPNTELSYLFKSCFHCAQPTCIKACPVNAITKRAEDGIVIVNRETCIGGEKCKYACRKACRYEAPQFGAEPNAKMQKCDLCLERWGENKKPICVEACPMRALDAGTMDELKAKYGSRQEAINFTYVKRMEPSVVLKSKSYRKKR